MKKIFNLFDMRKKIAEKECSDGFDKEQLEKGVEVEKEHTSNPEVAEKIAKDHLKESEDCKDGEGAKYYDKLEKVEDKIKEELKAYNYFDLLKFAKKGKKKKKKNNEYAICTESVGGKEGTTERSKWDQDAKDRYSRCLKHLNLSEHKDKKSSTSPEKIIEAKKKKDDGWPKELKKGRFTSYCKRNGFSGPSKACADHAMESDDASVRGMASFYVNTTLKRKKKKD